MLAAAAFGWLAGACTEPPRRTFLDLTEAMPFAHVDLETPFVDFGTERARPLLGDGWSWDESGGDGRTFVWATGSSAALDLYLASTRDRELRFRAFPFHYPGAPTQHVEILLDDEKVGRFELPPGPTEVVLPLAASRVSPGPHRIVFRFSEQRAVGEVLGTDDPRSLAAGFEWLSLYPKQAPTPRTASATPPEPSVLGQASDRLFLPFGTAVSFYFEAVAESRLAIDDLALRGLDEAPSGSLAVEWQPAGGRPALLVSVDADGADELDLPLPVASGPVRLTLRAEGPIRPGGEAGALLSNPRLTAPMPGTEGDSDAALVNDGSTVASEMKATQARASNAESPGSELRGVATDRDLLLFVIDTLRFDRLGAYGHPRDVSPHFDRLAERAYLFEHVEASSSWTKPTVATLLTGLGSRRHGIRGRDDAMAEGVLTLADHLRAAGYRTAGFSTNAHLTAETGFDRGFDHFHYAPWDATTVVERAIEWLESTGDQRPRFLWVHTIEPHAPYAPAEPWRQKWAPEVDDPYIGSVEHVRALGDGKTSKDDGVVSQMLDLYDAEVAANDHAMATLLDSFGSAEAPRPEAPLIVVVADHGEAFRERGVFGHGWDLHAEVTRVPMLLGLPGQSEGHRIRETVQQADLLPTLLELLGIDPAAVESSLAEPSTNPSPTEDPSNDGPSSGPAAQSPAPEEAARAAMTSSTDRRFDGDSLLPLLASNGATVSTFGTRPIFAHMDYEGRSGSSIVLGRYKLILPRSADFAPTARLYDLQEDPGEEDDLARRRPVIAGWLTSLLKQELAREAIVGEVSELDDERRRQLEALGYL